MATRNIHEKQPLAQGSRTLREAGSIGALHRLPRWQKYLKFGKIAEELGKKEAARMWRLRAYSFELDHGNYASAEALAAAYLGKREAGAANSLALLTENISGGRTNGDLRLLVSNALRSGAPLELVSWELSSVRRTHPDLTFHQWKSEALLQLERRFPSQPAHSLQLPGAPAGSPSCISS